MTPQKQQLDLVFEEELQLNDPRIEHRTALYCRYMRVLEVMRLKYKSPTTANGRSSLGSSPCSSPSASSSTGCLP